MFLRAHASLKKSYNIQKDRSVYLDLPLFIMHFSKSEFCSLEKPPRTLIRSSMMVFYTQNLQNSQRLDFDLGAIELQVTGSIRLYFIPLLLNFINKSNLYCLNANFHRHLKNVNDRPDLFNTF